MAESNIAEYILHDSNDTYFVNEKGELQTVKPIMTAMTVNGPSSMEKGIIEIDGKIVDTKKFEDWYDYKLGFESIQFRNKDKSIDVIMNDMVNEIKNIVVEIDNVKTWTRKVEYLRVDKQKEKDLQSGIQVIEEKFCGTYIEQKVQNNYKKIADMKNTLISVHLDKQNRPHFHLVFDRTQKYFGYKYLQLEYKIFEITKKYGLCSSNDVFLEHGKNAKENNEFLTLQERLENLSWAIEKHKKSFYIERYLYKIQSSESKYVVNLKNLGEKLNRYVELNGATDFAQEIINKLKVKVNPAFIEKHLGKGWQETLVINKTKEDTKAKELLDSNNFSGAVKEIVKCIKDKRPISPLYKKYVEANGKTNDFKVKKFLAALTELYIERRCDRKEINKNGSKFIYKYIDEKRIDAAADKYIVELAEYDKLEVRNEIIELFRENKYKYELELTLKTKGYFKNDLFFYKGQHFDLQEVFGKTKGEIFFANTREFVFEKIDKNRKFASISEVRDVLSEITNAERYIMSPSWNQSIAVEIFNKQMDEKAIVSNFYLKLCELEEEIRPMLEKYDERADIKRESIYIINDYLHMHMLIADKFKCESLSVAIFELIEKNLNVIKEDIILNKVMKHVYEKIDLLDVLIELLLKMVNCFDGMVLNIFNAIKKLVVKEFVGKKEEAFVNEHIGEIVEKVIDKLGGEDKIHQECIDRNYTSKRSELRAIDYERTQERKRKEFENQEKEFIEETDYQDEDSDDEYFFEEEDYRNNYGSDEK